MTLLFCRDEITRMEKLGLYADEYGKNTKSKTNLAIASDELTEEAIRSLETRILDKSISAYIAW